MESLILEISTQGLHRYEPIGKGVTTLGRALDNDIILSDPTVAPHHLKIVHSADGSLELINLAATNPTRIDGRRIDSARIDSLPISVKVGRVQMQLLSRDYPVAATRPLAGNDGRNHLFAHAYWALLLVLVCLFVGALEFFLNSYNSFKWNELFKYVLRETVLTIGAFVLALSILERLLVSRWEIRQLLTSVCLVYLLLATATVFADNLSYLFSATWPNTLFHLGWYLLVIPAAIALYLVHISHLKRNRSILLALLIASPISVPSILKSAEMRGLFDDFNSSANYHSNLSYLNWHLRDTISIDNFIEQARKLDAGEAVD